MLIFIIAMTVISSGLAWLLNKIISHWFAYVLAFVLGIVLAFVLAVALSLYGFSPVEFLFLAKVILGGIFTVSWLKSFRGNRPKPVSANRDFRPKADPWQSDRP